MVSCFDEVIQVHLIFVVAGLLADSIEPIHLTFLSDRYLNDDTEA